jgi:hypothetical protein
MIDPMAKLSSKRVPLALVLLLSLGGCAAAGLAVVGAGTGVAMGTGADYTLNGIAYKTFTAPIDDVKVATRSGLANMGIEVTKDGPTDKPGSNDWRIEAVANNRQVTIDLQPLTPKTTRIRVVAEDGIFFKDKATEAEIIFQTADALDNPDPSVASGRPAKAPARSTAARDEPRQ